MEEMQLTLTAPTACKSPIWLRPTPMEQDGDDDCCAIYVPPPSHSSSSSSSSTEEEEDGESECDGCFFDAMPEPPRYKYVDGIPDPDEPNAIYVCGGGEGKDSCYFADDRKDYFRLVSKEQRYSGDYVCFGCHGIIHRPCAHGKLGYTKEYVEQNDDIYCSNCQWW